MAEVTQTVNPKYNVDGSLREQFYTISGASGDTLTVGLNAVRSVSPDLPSTITAYAVTPKLAGTLVIGSIITFTASGAFSNLNVTVKGN
jgi:hypothetical protein